METYYGHVKSPSDAIILFEACRLGHLPRVQRRLSEKERQAIRSGSVFVWDEREAGMRRWTDGKSWSASRVSGSFLTYREMEGKRSGGSQFNSPMQGVQSNGNGMDRRRVDDDMGPFDGPDGYRYKPDGLMKQSFSITTSDGQHLHLISYYARSDPSSTTLTQPSNDPQLRSIRPEKGMYPETTMHDTPSATRSPMTASPYGTSPRNRQPENYLRHPPPQAGQAWPPSPMDTPPTYYSHQSPYGPGMPPPGGSGPMYYNRSYQGPGRPPGQTAFDRPPPPMSNGAMPLPPPSHTPSSPYFHSSSSSHYSSVALPPINSASLPPPTPSSSYPPPSSATSSYPPTGPTSSYPPPPPSSSAYPPPPSSSTYPPPPPSSAGYPPSNTYPPHQSPSMAARHRENGSQYTSSPYGPPLGYGPPANIDPRLNPHGPPTGQSKYDYPLPPPPPPPPPPPAANTASSTGPTKTIPSITSLINPTPVPAIPPQQQSQHYATNGHQDVTGRPFANGVPPKTEAIVNMAPILSPQQQNQQPQSPAQHLPQSGPSSTGLQPSKMVQLQRQGGDPTSLGSKMGFGEDSRLLRQLDRAFAA